MHVHNLLHTCKRTLTHTQTLTNICIHLFMGRMHTCMYVYIYIYIYTHKHLYTDAHAQADLQTQTPVNTHICAYTYIYMYMRREREKHKTCVNTHTHLCTDTDSRMHTSRQMCPHQYMHTPTDIVHERIAHIV